MFVRHFPVHKQLGVGLGVSLITVGLLFVFFEIVQFFGVEFVDAAGFRSDSSLPRLDNKNNNHGEHIHGTKNRDQASGQFANFGGNFKCLKRIQKMIEENNNPFDIKIPEGCESIGIHTSLSKAKVTSVIPGSIAVQNDFTHFFSGSANCLLFFFTKSNHGKRK